MVRESIGFSFTHIAPYVLEGEELAGKFANQGTAVAETLTVFNGQLI